MRWNGKRRSNVRELDDVVGNTIARPRAILMLLGVFALVALGARGSRRLRRDRVLGARADAGNRRAHGPRRDIDVGV